MDNILKSANKPLVAILMGSESDWPVMKEAAGALQELGIGFEAAVLSAHRTPQECLDFVRSASERGIRVLVGGAGGAAHLPGVMAANSLLPVIGVPIENGPLKGQDALLSIVQMPRGMPVATVAIGGAWNAGLLAAQILAVGSSSESAAIQDRLKQYRESLKRKVLSQQLKL